MHVKVFLVAATAIFFCGSVRTNAKIETRLPRDHTHPSPASATNPPAVTFNLQEYGSVGDGVTDDAPALQRALDAVANAGGGIIYVPAGRYAIATPVVKDFSNIPGARVTIQGVDSLTPIHVDGSGEFVTAGLALTSEFVIKTGETANALSLSGLEGLLIKDLLFIGTLDRLSDALVTISLSDIEAATIRHCEFYGLASFVPGGAIVLARHSRLNITETAFLGCTASTGLNTSVVQNLSWKNISISETVFTDYGQRPDFYGKHAWGATYSWIGIDNAARVDNLSPRREAFIYHVFLDEGHQFGITSRPGRYSTSEDASIDLIYVSRLRVNVNNLLGSGLYLSQARRVFVADSYFGWSYNTHSALMIVDVGEAVLDKVECDATADTIVADSRTNKLTVINSIYEHLDSAAQTTLVINTPTADDDPAQYVKQQFRNELEREPDAAAHDYWTNELLLCAGETQCVAARREDLARYLASRPSPIFSITGQITDEDGVGMPGVTVTLSGSQLVSSETDDNGEYVFAGLPTSGRYVITPTKNHYTFSAARESFDPSSEARTANFSAVLNAHSIRGEVTSSGYPMAGVTVALSGCETRTSISGSDGTYLFTDIDGGSNCTVTASKAHYALTPQSYTFDDLGSDQKADFGGAPVNYTISGKVKTPDGTAVAGANVVLSGSQTGTLFTNNTGDYSFSVHAEGNYTITSKACSDSTPANRTFINLSSSQMLADFVVGVPLLITEPNSDLAIALDSVIMWRDPFTIVNSLNFSLDQRTRISLFLSHTQSPCEDASVITVQAEDVHHTVHQFPVEFVGGVPNFSSLSQLIVKVPDTVAVGNAILTVRVHGIAGNQARLNLK